jgi:hypothetical protein
MASHQQKKQYGEYYFQWACNLQQGARWLPVAATIKMLIQAGRGGRLYVWFHPLEQRNNYRLAHADGQRRLPAIPHRFAGPFFKKSGELPLKRKQRDHLVAGANNRQKAKSPGPYRNKKSFEPSANKQQRA